MCWVWLLHTWIYLPNRHLCWEGLSHFPICWRHYFYIPDVRRLGTQEVSTLQQTKLVWCTLVRQISNYSRQVTPANQYTLKRTFTLIHSDQNNFMPSKSAVLNLSSQTCSIPWQWRPPYIGVSWLYQSIWLLRWALLMVILGDYPCVLVKSRLSGPFEFKSGTLTCLPYSVQLLGQVLHTFL